MEEHKESMAIVSESLSSIELTQKDGVYSWKIKVYAANKQETPMITESKLNSIEGALQRRYGKKWPAPKDIRAFLLETSSTLAKIKKRMSKPETVSGAELEIDSLQMAINTMLQAFNGS